MFFNGYQATPILSFQPTLERYRWQPVEDLAAPLANPAVGGGLASTRATLLFALTAVSL
jgi:hypothetical protein